MKKNLVIIIGLNIVLALAIRWAYNVELSMNRQESMSEVLKKKYGQKSLPATDHSKFEILQKKFDTPQAVTQACISCHTERHKEVMESNHWNWEREEYIEGRGVTYLGKSNLLNNYCIGASSNEQACAKCHIGYDFESTPNFYKKEENVDCLVCHDNSGEYMKGGGLAGLPAGTVDLGASARHVGNPTKESCGSCHFYSGGGNNVKHGDLEEAQTDCSREVDVHMASQGVDMSCVDCHSADKHNIKGKLYSVSSANKNRAECQTCHGELPHESEALNTHTAKVACQTCHIPSYAKANATKMSWDWSTAGKLKDGKPYSEDDSLGNHTYMSIKGSFTWAKNVTPEYVWFNGTADHYVLGDKVDTLKAIKLNELFGSYSDGKIMPVKVHRGRQPYDPVNKTLIQPFTYAKEKGKGAYWKDFDWQKASEIGMKEVGLPFSGEVTFPKTEMYWPVNHMVSPADKSLSCADCHTNSPTGRLANLKGFYLPGRDGHSGVDFFGKWLLILSCIGLVGHAGLRILSGLKSKQA
ncbi:cytochrome c (plasmid) [Fulvitalea axinellae]|uniref:Cytochrome c n=1 Tax=Fulvitalea axinellae TaxID=1182444 RepID=A0AAU9CU53_9BACT|nr:cytochrome c [Fulvitalea axinellae]